MTFFQKIRSYFGSSRSLEPENINFDTSLSQSSSFSTGIDELPQWMLSEEDLRDEAVIYGYSGASITEKLLVIENHFESKGHDLQKDLSLLDEKILELNLSLEKHSRKLEEFQNKINLAASTPYIKTNWIRILAGLVLSILMCVGNFFLLQYWLRPIMTSQWILWGIFLTGTFSLFSPISLFHQKDQKPAWRQWIEELGLPVAASLFIFTLSYKQVGLTMALGYLLFQFFTFLLTGKLMLANIVLSHDALQNLRYNFELFNRKGKKSWQSDSDKLEIEIDKLRSEKWKQMPALNQCNFEIKKLQAHKSSMLNLFHSEYELAKNYKDKLKLHS